MKNLLNLGARACIQPAISSYAPFMRREPGTKGWLRPGEPGHRCSAVSADQAGSIETSAPLVVDPEGQVVVTFGFGGVGMAPDGTITITISGRRKQSAPLVAGKLTTCGARGLAPLVGREPR